MPKFMDNYLQAIQIPSGTDYLNGLLYLPQSAKGLVIFAHGSGSSRLSPRNQQVAKWFNQANLGTLLFDLLTPGEETIDNATREFRFDIELLASRLMDVTSWCQADPMLGQMRFGYFGASTGAAAALVAASEMPKSIEAVVSRGGRPDLAGENLPHVKAPTLLIVGELDEEVCEMNQAAMAQMRCPTQLEIIPGATHLFEEKGTLEQAAMKAQAWFLSYL